jgi:FAD binding domain-containing protein
MVAAKPVGFRGVMLLVEPGLTVNNWIGYFPTVWTAYNTVWTAYNQLTAVRCPCRRPGRKSARCNAELARSACQTDLCELVGIIGAGPAGLFAVNVLVRAGIDYEIFERLDEGAVRARAGLIEVRTARLLDAYGLADGLLKRARPSGLVSSGVEAYGMSSTTGP